MKAAGVVVGRVESVRLDPKIYDAVVTLRLDQITSSPGHDARSTPPVSREVYISLVPAATVMLKTATAPQDAVCGRHREKRISQVLFDKAAAARGEAAAPVKSVEKPAGETKK